MSRNTSAPRTLRVETAPPYDVRIGAGVLAELPACLAAYGAHAVLTDHTVERLYARALPASATRLLAVPDGERSKSCAELERVLDFLVVCHLDRRGCLVAFGGGVVGDLGGLAAALYMRGIAFVQVPTTLLAQVDSSVGGKTAINLAGGKNLAGAFHQPSAVFADTALLATLAEGEYQSGLGEVVKTALLAGEDFVALLERETRALAARDASVLAEIVARCVAFKAHIVARDPHECGERKALNLGHTFAHGIEHDAGYGTVPHGLAVAVGIVLALRASAEFGVLRDPELVARVQRLFAALGLPADLATLRTRYGATLRPRGLLDGMRHDKKSAEGRSRFVLLERAGAWRLDVEAPDERVERLLATSGP